MLDFCRLAKDHGADNVRLSLRFGPEGNDFFTTGQLDIATTQAAEAERTLNSDRFRVINLIPERRANQDAMAQDYEPCYTMRSLCVIGGDAKVYTCCTLAFTPSGEMGDLRKSSFADIWSADYFRRFSVRKSCAVQCLYEARNKAMIRLVDGADTAPPDPSQPHRNFI